MRRVHLVDGNSCARAHLYRSEDCQVFLRFCGLDPNVFHVDQLTCILRYVLPSGPVERFLAFFSMRGHSGIQLAESLLEYLKTNDIDIADYRGQSYDNASNMSGKYNGMQAIIRQHCNLAEYVHSLNLACWTVVSKL